MVPTGVTSELGQLLTWQSLIVLVCFVPRTDIDARFARQSTCSSSPFTPADEISRKRKPGCWAGLSLLGPGVGTRFAMGIEALII